MNTLIESDTREWTVGKCIADDFVVEGFLGRGGMGIVYQVVSLSTGQTFAVKTVNADALSEDMARRNFLKELLNWVELPTHPHFTACRFWRTVEDKIVIFAEFVAGKSLAAGIAEHRVVSLDCILDIAIQWAWGLHALHHLGLVHHDVKPGNVLLTPDGVAKITDFGLARARAHARVSSPAPRQGSLLSHAGMTLAYRSPEQAIGRPVNLKTDVWSWGVSLLEMFTSRVSWAAGEIAGTVLDKHLRKRGVAGRPPLPVSVAEVLQRCFHQNPEERWSSMAEAADALVCIYRETFGRRYPRPFPPLPERSTVPQTVERSPAIDWLMEALRLAGRNPSEAENLFPLSFGSPQGQAIAHLQVYDEAQHILEHLDSNGRTDLKPLLARLYAEKAETHANAFDLIGAAAFSQRACFLYDRMVNNAGRRELMPDLASIYGDQAVFASRRGDQIGALQFNDRAIPLFEQLVKVDRRADMAEKLATAYNNKAAVCALQGRNAEARILYDQAIHVLESLLLCEREGLVEVVPGRTLADALGETYVNQAMTLRTLGDDRTAVSLFDRAIEIYLHEVEVEIRIEMTWRLAWAYKNKADALGSLGEQRVAIPAYDRAINLYCSLAGREARVVWDGQLAEVYANKAVTLNQLGDITEAAAHYRFALAIWEQLVHEKGLIHLAGRLAEACAEMAVLTHKSGDRNGGEVLFTRAIEIYDRLLKLQWKEKMADRLAWTCMQKALLTELEKGDAEGVITLLGRAIQFWRQLICDDSPIEQIHHLAVACYNRAVAMTSLGDWQGAHEYCQQAIALYAGLQARSGQSEFGRGLRLAQGFLTQVIQPSRRSDGDV